MQQVPAQEQPDHPVQWDHRAVRPPHAHTPPKRSANPARVPYRAVGGPVRLPSSQQPAAAPPEAAQNWLQRMARGVRAAFIDRDFARLWWGQLISSVGDYAWDTALVLWIASQLTSGQSWSPLAISGVVLAAAVPQIVVGPLAGVFVDRWDKQRTMVAAALLQAIFAALLILVAFAGRLPVIGVVHLPVGWQLAVIYADVAILTTLAQFFNPAELALIKDIVPAAKQDQALEATQAIQALAVIIGPPVAAALVFGVGLQWALLLNSLSFVVVFLAVRSVQAPPAAHSIAPGDTSHFSREFLDGLGYVTGHRVLRTVLVAELLTWLGFGALQTLGYFFITGNLHAPPGAYGVFGAVFGVGAVVGAVLITLFGQRVGLARLLWSSLVTAGVFVIVMSHVTTLGVALVAAAVFGIASSAILVVAGPLTLDGTAREYVGRVTAVINPLGRLAALISIVVAGTLVSTVLRGFHASLFSLQFGPVNTIFTATGLLALAGGLYARISLRSMDGQQWKASPATSSPERPDGATG